MDETLPVTFRRRVAIAHEGRPLRRPRAFVTFSFGTIGSRLRGAFLDFARGIDWVTAAATGNRGYLGSMKK
jgi:hypothetical protein